jgi:hypothetical protein
MHKFTWDKFQNQTIQSFTNINFPYKVLVFPWDKFHTSQSFAKKNWYTKFPYKPQVFIWSIQTTIQNTHKC